MIFLQTLGQIDLLSLKHATNSSCFTAKNLSQLKNFFKNPPILFEDYIRRENSWKISKHFRYLP